MRDYRGLRREVERLKARVPAAGADGPPPHFWDWLPVASCGGVYPDAAADAACRTWWEGELRKVDASLSGRCRAAGVDFINLKIQALLACPPGASAEVVEAKMWEILNGSPRPPLPIGLRELPKEDRHEP